MEKLPYTAKSIKTLRKTKSWREVAVYYHKDMLTVQKFYYRKMKEERDKNGSTPEKPKEPVVNGDKDMSFYRFIYKELFGTVSRYDTKAELLRKIAKEINKRASQY